MIKIAGSVHRSFIFPADLPTAFAFYGDMSRSLHYPPHISLLHRYDEHTYRMLYSTTELGIYRVRVICDLQVQLDRAGRALRIRSLDPVTPVKSEAGMYSLSGYGQFESESLFTEEDLDAENLPAGQHTCIEYRLKLSAGLPVPLGLRLVPVRVIQGIANSIVDWRMAETAEGFIERSIQAFEARTLK